MNNDKNKAKEKKRCKKYQDESKVLQYFVYERYNSAVSNAFTVKVINNTGLRDAHRAWRWNDTVLGLTELV